MPKNRWFPTIKCGYYIEGLAEKNHWFGCGSRIILTTRDESLLKSTYKKEGYIIHRVDKLKQSEALHLFSLKAFKSDCPPEDYQALSEKVVEYAKGLPLALEVLGSFLGTCESIDEWKSALERLKKNPEEDIMKTLKISFDALKETEKNIFLDIACFFNGCPKEKIMAIMDACGFFPKIGIRSLVDKSLLHMDRNTLRMHDLLEEMGKDIVRKESRNEPGRRSRIWLWDDLNHVMSNDTVSGNKRDWFGYGSRIILTTRNKRVLRSAYKKEERIIHEVEELKDNEAFQLFSRNAFKSDCPPEDYRALSEKVVKYAKGLPLALEVLGSFLGTCESMDEWKSALERLKKYPEKDITKILQISFDALDEPEKNIFLDIACFFNGYPKEKIMEIMDACGFFPKIGIRSLVDKSLLHMDRNTLRMHDLLEEMGKDIVRKESRNEPGRRSRIWLWDDLNHVMNNDTVSGC